MRDVVFVTAVVAFFVVAVLYVRACGVVVGRTDGAGGAGVGPADDGVAHL